MKPWKVVALTLAAAAVLAAATHRAGQAAIPPPYPPQVEAERILADKLALFGSGYKGQYDLARKLIYVTALDDSHLRQAVQLVVSFTDAFAKTLAVPRPNDYVTIFLPTQRDFRRLVPDKQVTGCYRPSDRTVISIDRKRVLLHELTHALHHADCASESQWHNVWVWEGLASLCECSAITPSGIEPLIDARISALQGAIRSGRTIPLAEMLRMEPPEFAGRAGLCYAQARYLMLYLHRKGKLAAWYAAHKEAFSDDGSGRLALEKVLGSSLPRIEEDWKSWASQLKPAWGEYASGQGRLGLGLRDTKSGPEVVACLPGSSAELAGQIKPGDVILSLGGHKTANAVEVVAAIRSTGAMRTVVVELRRNGRVLTINQALDEPGASPVFLPPAQP